MEAPCVRVHREEGETVRRELAEAGLLDYSYDIANQGDWLFIPIIDPDGVGPDRTVVTHEVQPRETPTLPGDGLDFDPTYERLGDIILLDEEDPDRAKAAAKSLLDSDLPVKTVLNKASKVKGPERVREWTVLAGDGTMTIHREYGCEFALDIAEVYFTPRLATERHRVVEQVEAGEQVFDMFTGVGPFAIPIAQRGATVVAVDINPVAIEYLRENAERNGVEDRLTAVEGDVREVASEYENWANRIVMNLPHSADVFLESALVIAGDSCVIHYYDIQSDDDPFTPGEAAIRSSAGPEYEVTIDDRRVVRSYAPGEVNVCLDVRLHRK